MKKALAILTILVLFLSATALAEEAGTLSWRNYKLQAVWLTTDHGEISIPNLRDDGLVVLIRLAPTEGTVAHTDINDHADEFFLRDANGNDVPVSTLLFHKLIQPEGGGFPSIDPEQDNFDLLFFLQSSDETVLHGASLAVASSGAEQVLALDNVSRKKPEVN